MRKRFNATHNPKVVSSSLAPATQSKIRKPLTKVRGFFAFWGDQLETNGI